MSFFDDASLAFLPSGGAGKDTKAYSIKPTDGSGDFTFSRGSNLAATRVGPTGLIEKGRENLLLQSNNFTSSSWSYNTAGNVLLTSGQTGYDGSSDAWEAKNDGRAYFRQFVTYPNQVQTFSVYAKSGNQDYFNITIVKDGGDPSVTCDLGLGTITSGDPDNIDAAITPVTGATGWYRISLTWLAASTGSDQIRINTGPNLGDTIIIQDAQLEIGLAATDYIESGATTGKAGLLEDEPRFDYSGGATCPSLLLEPSRTNYYISSEWILNLDSDLSQELSDINSPIENTPFLKLTKNTSGLARQTLYTSTNGDIDTCSVFVKKGSAGGNKIYFADSFYGTATMNASFDLDTGSWSVPPSGTALVDYGFENFGNGMYRIWVAGRTMDASNPDSTRWRTPALFFDNGQLAVGEYIYITGLQTERNASYPTSYIPNHSGGSVTRGTEDCSVTGVSDLIGQTEGTLYWEGEKTSNVNFAIALVIENGTTNRIYLISGSTGFRVDVTDSNTTTAFYSGTHALGNYKIAIAYNSSSVEVYINGASVFNDSSVTIPACENIYLANWASYSQSIKTHKAVLFKERLSNADLETLTT